MRYINLTKGKRVIVDNEDFEWLSQWRWYYHNLGYAVRGKGIYMHKLINKTPDGFQTDHINRNKLDNRKKNLRTVNQTQNRYNIGLQKNNTSGYKGVIWNKDKKLWFACIYKNSKRIYLGSSKDIIEAYTFRKQAERIYIQ